MVEAVGCAVRFLPAYSPDFSPIEWACSKLKTCLRAAMARSRDALERAITAGLDRITADDDGHSLVDRRGVWIVVYLLVTAGDLAENMVLLNQFHRAACRRIRHPTP